MKEKDQNKLDDPINQETCVKSDQAKEIETIMNLTWLYVFVFDFVFVCLKLFIRKICQDCRPWCAHGAFGSALALCTSPGQGHC